MPAVMTSTRIQENIGMVYCDLAMNLLPVPAPPSISIPAFVDFQGNDALLALIDQTAGAGSTRVEAMNAGYLRVSRSMQITQNIIEGNTDAQEEFNDEVEEGGKRAGGLGKALKEAVGKVFNIENISKALDISDASTQMNNQLNSINDGAQTTQQLMDMVYASAKHTHTPFLDTAAAVTEMGKSAGSAFGSNAEMIAFMEQANKQFALGGVSAEEQSQAVLQLGEAMSDGVLNADEMNSVLGSAPGIAKTIEQSMGWAEGSLASYADQGMVTSQVVKDSLFKMAEDTNAKYDSMPITFSQAMNDFKSSALMAFEPILQKISELVNSPMFQTFAQGASVAFSMVADALMNIIDLMCMVGGFMADNWSIILPIVLGVVGAMIAYQIVTNGAAIAAAAAKIATAAWTAVQGAFNVVMSLNPVGLIIALVVLLIGVIIGVCAWIAKTSDAAGSTFGVICGGINVVIQWFKNLALTVANIALGIAGAIGALGENIMAAFHNSFCDVKAGFYGLLSVALHVVEGICEALNKLPFVEFEYSGITEAADEYAAKMQEQQGNKREYVSISEAFEKGNSTFETFEDGWAGKAFDSGAAFGDGAADKVAGFFNGLFGGKEDSASMDDLYDKYGSGLAGEQSGYLEGVNENLDQIAGDTGSINDSVGVSSEDLQYLRDIAEQEAINRFTTAEIKVQMNNSNHIRQGADLDGIIDGLTTRLVQSMETVREGA